MKQQTIYLKNRHQTNNKQKKHNLLTSPDIICLMTLLTLWLLLPLHPSYACSCSDLLPSDQPLRSPAALLLQSPYVFSGHVRSVRPVELEPTEGVCGAKAKEGLGWFWGVLRCFFSFLGCATVLSLRILR